MVSSHVHGIFVNVRAQDGVLGALNLTEQIKQNTVLMGTNYFCFSPFIFFRCFSKYKSKEN